MLDLTNDYVQLDFQETVHYVSAPLTTGERTWVTTAVQFPLAEKEAVASGGAYVSFTKLWDIANSQLMGTEPKLGDVIIDAAAIQWTVQAISYSAATKAWLLNCVNLRLAANLSDVLTVEAPINLQDSSLSRIPVWTIKRTGVAARFQEVSGGTVDERGRRVQELRYAIICSARVAVNHEDRLLDAAGNIYQYDGHESADRLDLLMQINARRVSDSGG